MRKRKLFEGEPEALEKLTELYGDGAENSAVLLYFDKVRPFLRQMDDREAAELFRSLIGYAMTGEVPDCPAAKVELAFEVIRPSIDSKQREFRENHARGVVHGKYMAYCREQKDVPRLTEEEFARLLIAAAGEPEAACSSNTQEQEQEQEQKQDQKQDQKEGQKEDRTKELREQRFARYREPFPPQAQERPPALWKTCG